MNERSRGRKAVCLLALALMSGCVDQAREVSLYKKQLDTLPGATIAVPGDYTPLTMQDALRLAEKNNESLGLSGETYVQALIAKDKAFSAFLPTVSLNPTYSQVQRTRGMIGSAHDFEVPLEANTNLFNGFRDEASLEQNDAAVIQNRELLLNEQQAVLLDVVQAYYKVLTDERSVTVLQNSLAEQDERVRQSKAKFELGNGTPLDVAQSESQASSTRVSLIQAVADVKTDRAMLTFLIGSPCDGRPLTDGYEPPRDIGQPLSAWPPDRPFASRLGNIFRQSRWI
jgi:outer membrane protein TolC